MTNIWTKEWNDIIRYVLFADDELKRLMKLPANTSIIEFVDNYFIRGGSVNKILSNQSVRINYGNIHTNELDNTPYMTENTLSFDIYVKKEDLHNVSNDRLEMRTIAIADRLKYLLLKNRYVIDLYRFRVCNECDLATSTIGYARYNISFKYLKVV